MKNTSLLIITLISFSFVKAERSFTAIIEDRAIKTSELIALYSKQKTLLNLNKLITSFYGLSYPVPPAFERFVINLVLGEAFSEQQSLPQHLRDNREQCPSTIKDLPWTYFSVAKKIKEETEEQNKKIAAAAQIMPLTDTDYFMALHEMDIVS